MPRTQRAAALMECLTLLASCQSDGGQASSFNMPISGGMGVNKRYNMAPVCLIIILIDCSLPSESAGLCCFSSHSFCFCLSNEGPQINKKINKNALQQQQHDLISLFEDRSFCHLCAYSLSAPDQFKARVLLLFMGRAAQVRGLL